MVDKWLSKMLNVMRDKKKIKQNKKQSCMLGGILRTWERKFL